MSNTSIQLKKSGISGNTPVDLIYGEVAINYADGKLFYKSDTGVTRYITNQQSFSTINSNNSLILATTGTDILNLVAGNNITISTNTTSKSITFGLPKDITNLNSISANTVSTKDILVTGIIQTSTHSNLEGFIQAAFDTANTGGGGGGGTVNTATLFHFPVGDYGYVADPLMGGIGDSEFVNVIYDMRVYPGADAGLINIDLGTLS